MNDQETPRLERETSNKKKQINFLGIRTTTNRLFQSSIEDANFVCDWLYFDWIYTNWCSSTAMKTAVTVLIIIASILYILEACDGRLLQLIFNSCGTKSFHKRTYVILLLLVFFEGVPQIAITVLGENQLLGDDCGTEFASQAFSNLFTSGYAVAYRLLEIYECRQDAGEEEEEDEIVVQAQP